MKLKRNKNLHALRIGEDRMRYKKKHKQQNTAMWKVVTGVLAVMLATMTCLYIYSLANPQQKALPSTQQSQPTESRQSTEDSAKAAPLSLWTDTAKLKKELTSFVSDVTKLGGENYIPVKNRVAVFDFDGTLFCETDPCSLDYRLLRYRVTEDPDYKDRASLFEREVAGKIERYINGESVDGLEVDHGKAVASAFSGMTVDEFEEYVDKFRRQPSPSYQNMTNGQGFYQPMLQVIRYLQDNDFTVYVISDSDRLFVRGVCKGVLNLPDSHIIGSDESLVADHQMGADGLDYQYSKDDKLILGGDFLVKNLRMNKVSVIAREIGVQPVLSFGNSSGDTSMANYTITNNPYKSAAYMLCCDDTVRENGDLKKAQEMEASCKENGWTAVSMKKDWLTIYGDSVKRITEKTN